jgi:hypothetical protein
MFILVLDQSSFVQILPQKIKTEFFQYETLQVQTLLFLLLFLDAKVILIFLVHNQNGFDKFFIHSI